MPVWILRLFRRQPAAWSCPYCGARSAFVLSYGTVTHERGGTTHYGCTVLVCTAGHDYDGPSLVVDHVRQTTMLTLRPAAG